MAILVFLFTKRPSEAHAGVALRTSSTHMTAGESFGEVHSPMPMAKRIDKIFQLFGRGITNHSPLCVVTLDTGSMLCKHATWSLQS